MKKLLSLLLLVVAFSGCAHTWPNEGVVDNILAVDKLGAPLNPAKGEVFVNAVEIDEHIRKLLPHDQNSVLIFIHGGLNIESTANERANIYTEHMKTDGYWPVFITWPSGFFSTYLEHTFFLRQGEYWTWTGPMTSPVVLVEDLGRGVIRTPMVWYYQGRDFSKSVVFDWLPNEKNAKKVNQMLAIEQPSRFAEVPSVVDAKGDLVGEQKWLSAIGNGLKGVAQTTLGLITAPIFDSFGTSAWDDMKRRTQLTVARTWIDKPTFDTVDSYVKEREGGVVAFFEALKKRQQENKDLKIVLIGHSMGTIVANNILRQWPEIKYDRIVYMAAACSIEDFEAAVIPQLKSNPAARFFNYMLHPIAENREAHMYGLGGTGTLLNQIDNIYENAVSMNQRTLGKWENVMNGIEFFDVPGIQNRLYFRTMPLNGSSPTTHGAFADKDFNNDNVGWFWQEDFSIKTKSEPKTP